MSIKIDDFFKMPNIDDWTNETQRILKIDDEEVLEKKLNKVSLEGITYRTMYLDSGQVTQLNTFPEKRIFAREIIKADDINKDVEGGIENFISSSPHVLDKSVNLIQVLKSRKHTIFGDKVLIDLLALLEEFDFNVEAFKKEVDKISSKNKCDFFIDTRLIHNAGGSIVQELASALSFAKYSFEHLNPGESQIYFGVSCDSKYFLNISKLRALRYMWETTLENESMSTETFKIISFNSLREQTLYDSSMNMLRNAVSTTAGFIGGADIIAPSSYDSLNEVYGNSDISSVGHRQSRNMLHVLNEESGLTNVLDSSKGSYTIEALTCSFIEQSYELFKSYENQGGLIHNLKSFSYDVVANSKHRLLDVQKRKLVLSGINDYANTTEKLHKSIKTFESIKSDSLYFPHMRLAQEFELLRFKLEKAKNTKKVLIILFGDQSKLSARKIFTMNYFETIGLECDIHFYSNPRFDINESDYIALVFCANDSDYDQFLEEAIADLKVELPIYISGKKMSLENCTNIYGGQNVYNVLNELVSKGDF